MVAPLSWSRVWGNQSGDASVNSLRGGRGARQVGLLFPEADSSASMEGLAWHSTSVPAEVREGS
jgi:hypothetical protein